MNLYLELVVDKKEVSEVIEIKVLSRKLTKSSLKTPTLR